MFSVINKKIIKKNTILGQNIALLDDTSHESSLGGPDVGPWVIIPHHLHFIIGSNFNYSRAGRCVM